MTIGVSNRMSLRTGAGDILDWAGLDSVKVRIQLGNADEFTAQLPALNNGGNWRQDMAVWQPGAKIQLHLGYDDELHHIQTFMIVSTTVDYPEGDGEISMTVRAVSDLARALHNKEARIFDESNDLAVVEAICNEYGWTPDVPNFLSTGRRKRIKKKGDTDLDLLRVIAKEASLGAPRLTVDNRLIMPEPVIGDKRYVRGRITDVFDRRLKSFKPSREGGADTIELKITAWDPEQGVFVDKIFTADEFNEAPKLVFEGPASTQPKDKEISVKGLQVAVLAAHGHSASSKREVLSTGKFINEDDAEDLARRYFDLKEKLGRWCSICVDGEDDLFPYISVEIDGFIANSDKGVWLPTVINHTIDSNGWKADLTCIRVVDETTVSPAS